MATPMVRRRITAALTAGLLLGAPLTANADEQELDGSSERTAADAVAEELDAAAEEAGVPPEELREQEVTVGEDEDGEPVTITVEDLLVELAGVTLIDGDRRGVAGLPWSSVGNVLHTYVNVEAGAHLPLPLTSPDLPELPTEEELLRYDIVESGFTPETPILPVINPLLLLGGAGLDLPDDGDDGSATPGIAVLDQPLLGAHWGGRLINVQGDDWTVGFHSAGTTPLGTSIDTEDVSDDPDATLPVRIPLLEEGEMAVSDEAIDFTGFALVTQGGECERIVVTLPFVGQRAVGFACLSVGVLLGDGISLFDGEAPGSPRDALEPLFDDAPEPLDQLIDALGDGLGQLPFEDLLELLDLPDVGEDPQPEPTLSRATSLTRTLGVVAALI